MRNFIIVFTTILSGLAYGWCIVHYPITAQIIAQCLVIMAVVFWFFVMFMSLKKEGGDEAPQSNLYDK